MIERWHRELLDRARIAHLGTIGASGEPHLVPVCFAFVEDAIAIAIDEKPKKETRGIARLRNIERDRRVTLLVDHYEDEDWSKLAWVRLHGTATILERGDSWAAALEALRLRYRQYRAMELEALPMILVTPDRVASWRWTSEEPVESPGAD